MVVDFKKVSYILAQSIGGDFRRKGFDIDADIFCDSFKAAMKGEQPTMPAGEMQQVMMAFQQHMQEEMQKAKDEVGEKNRAEGRAFLGENAKKEGVVVTESGLQYTVVEEGTGKTPSAKDQVTVHYEGRLLDGSIFDSSYKREQPATFPVNGVIEGWQEALQLMKEGAKYELVIPASIGYGAQGAGDAIGPNATLCFTVELIKVLG
ncbi:FKBP-type peptidyl-prolyl cis-trans isomerase [Desulfoluna butyratoxydans]|uniref:Peptidyl-prolyl cis-trans isomerase n=1 Tax=Desulfoluna butyratoxydans TaxID=231438 RepID=A0A4U8YY35_9BACT|nr:FKBP-type peptidyl-prolyl cis-trans isomerase [Desulfoluna butyratoxydans]VFQ46393.1 fkbp-type peptidyl-prolyl cis-trans isomerase [Desulfoluna butyratoxydans]